MNQVIVVETPPFTNLSTPKARLVPREKLEKWIWANGFVANSAFDVDNDSGIDAFVKDGDHRFQDFRFCELFINHGFDRSANFAECSLRGQYRNQYGLKSFEFACTFDHALVFVQTHFAY